MAANAFFCSRIVGEPFAYTTTTDMENIYVECIEQILQVAPPVEEARELIMRVVKQELQYTDLLTEAQKEEADLVGRDVLKMNIVGIGVGNEA